MARAYPAESADLVRQCVVCDATFVRERMQTAVKTCSAQCRVELSRRRERRRQYSKSKPMVECAGCGKLIRQRRGNTLYGRYCSQECALSVRRRPEPLCVPDRCSIRPFACKWCGTISISRHRKRFCDKDCFNKFYNCNVRIRPEELPWRHEVRTCSRCLAFFVPASESQVWCSKQCGKRVRKQRRRANGPKDQIAIGRLARRDGWICQLCAGPVNREAFSNHNLDATIDHIVPVSQGGTHTWDNVQLAHFICNSRRGTSPLPRRGLMFEARQLRFFDDWQG